MTVGVFFRPEARSELEEAYDWYELQQPGLGERFRAAVDTSLNKIREAPLLYPRVRGQVRRICLNKFPFCVFYLVQQQRIVITAVFHGRRNPRRWQRRG